MSVSERAPSDGPPRTAGSPARPRRRIAGGVALQLIAMFAIALLVYTDAADWFARRGHVSEISGYIERVEDTPSEERRRVLEAAYTYNEQLQPGPLADPYISQNPDEALRSDVYRAYEDLLRISGTDTIGTLSYPRLGISLPVYHGTSNEVISKGAGHLYGTSLPVGGPSTRSVLTAHSGLPHASLFTELLQAEVGDVFWVSVLGEDHYYQVEDVETVLPGETESLEIIEGEDWVTLFTCSPIGVNSHRFLVHAVRIPAPDDAEQQIVPDDQVTAGFPWWAVIFVAGSAGTALIIFPPRRRGRSGAARSAAPRR